jgi:hypothetical protein
MLRAVLYLVAQVQVLVAYWVVALPLLRLLQMPPLLLPLPLLLLGVMPLRWALIMELAPLLLLRLALRPVCRLILLVIRSKLEAPQQLQQILQV